MKCIMVEKIVGDDEKMEFYPAPRRMKDIEEHHVTPFTHIVYAVTWFSLAFAGTLMTYSMFKRKRLILRKNRRKVSK